MGRTPQRRPSGSKPFCSITDCEMELAEKNPFPLDVSKAVATLLPISYGAMAQPDQEPLSRKARTPQFQATQCSVVAGG
jgi:hypothetical protein